MQIAVKHLSPVKGTEEEEGEEKKMRVNRMMKVKRNLIFCMILVLVCLATKMTHHLKKHFRL